MPKYQTMSRPYFSCSEFLHRNITFSICFTLSLVVCPFPCTLHLPETQMAWWLHLYQVKALPVYLALCVAPFLLMVDKVLMCHQH